MARNTMEKHFSLKDHLFNVSTVGYLADLFSKQNPQFRKSAFVREVMTNLQQLELKERIVWIAEVLEGYLNPDFKLACKEIVEALPEPLDPTKTDDDFGSFIFAPLGVYVVRNGLTHVHLQTSLETLCQLTQRFSMEDSIRYFINAFEKETFHTLRKWARHEHYHVRRLVSEGTRARLPWSRRLTVSYKWPGELLDMLHADTTRYVTRSVANHLNDIAKEDPEFVIETLARWQKQAKQTDAEMGWITKHALRTLIKTGNKDALMLLGFSVNPEIEINTFSLNKDSKRISPGETLQFNCEITAENEVRLVVDYVIGFVKANGLLKEKVFKFKKVHLQKGEKITLSKKHRFVKDATTYTLHRGVHTLTLQINGQQLMTKKFTVQ